MKELFYRKGNVTVCLLVDEDTKNVMARGVSIRSSRDEKASKDGHNRARGRANQAICHQKNASPVREDELILRDDMKELYNYKKGLVLFNMESGDRKFNYKAYYKPTLTVLERELVENVVTAQARSSTVEQQPFKLNVAGSNPTEPTMRVWFNGRMSGFQLEDMSSILISRSLKIEYGSWVHDNVRGHAKSHRSRPAIGLGVHIKSNTTPQQAAFTPNL